MVKHQNNITVVIPSNKQHIHTLTLNPWLRNYRVVVLRNSMGIAPAFNEAARQVRTSVMVLMGDDLKVGPQVQEYFGVRQGEFCMLETGAFPVNGVQVIRTRDFWRVGGFNEAYRYGSVDSEFYARAVLCGLRYRPIPISLVKHVRHPTRASTVHKLICVCRDRAMFAASYLRYYPVQLLKHDYVFRLMRGQPRTAVLNALFLIMHILKVIR